MSKFTGHEEPNRSELYSVDPWARLAAARLFAAARSTSHPPRVDELPAELQGAAATLGRECFGAINAWLVFVGPSPGGSPAKAEVAARFSGDHVPVLGRPHPHFNYPDTSGFWTRIQTWLFEAFRRGAGIEAAEDALSLSLVTNLLEDQSADSDVLDTRLPEGLPRFRAVLGAARPRLVVALKRSVFEAILNGLPPGTRRLEEQIYTVRRYRPPNVWVEMPDMSRLLIARAPNHPSRQHPIPETYEYLGRLVERARE